MRDVVLPLVEPGQAEERPVLGFTHYPDLQPFSSGTGDLNLLCGRCGFVLVAGITSGAEVPAMLIRCPSCGERNDPDRPEGVTGVAAAPVTPPALS